MSNAPPNFLGVTTFGLLAVEVAVGVTAVSDGGVASDRARHSTPARERPVPAAGWADQLSRDQIGESP